MTPYETTISQAKGVAARHGVNWREIMGRSRMAYVARARRHCWLEFYRRGYSSCQIGRIFDRDHSTVLYGLKLALKEEGEA